MKYKHHIPLFLLLILAVLSFFIVKPIALAVFLGALLAYLFYPVHDFLSSKIKNRVIPPLFVTVMVLFLILVPGTFLLTLLGEQAYSLFLTARDRFSTGIFGIFDQCSSDLCLKTKELAQNLANTLHLQDLLKTVAAWILQRGSAILISVPRFLLNVFLVFFSMFYFLKDGKEFIGKVGELLGFGEERYSFIMKRLKEIIRGLIFGSILVALLQGALGALGFFIFGVPLPLLWGLIMAFLALIPALGTGIIWFPASAMLVLQGVLQNSKSLIIRGILLFVYSLLVVSSVDNVLKPKLVSNRAKVHPLIIFTGIFGGLFFFGMWGVIIGPLILSLTIVLIEVLVLSKSEI